MRIKGRLRKIGCKILWLQSREVSAAYRLCKVGYGISIEDTKYSSPDGTRTSRLSFKCLGTRYNTPTCRDFGADVFTFKSKYKRTPFSFPIPCLSDGVVYTAPGEIASVSDPFMDAVCKRGYRASASPHVSMPWSWTVTITKGAQSSLCVSSEAEDVWAVVGITAAKVFCTYAFLVALYVFSGATTSEPR
jgi:hypothetical protein